MKNPIRWFAALLLLLVCAAAVPAESHAQSKLKKLGQVLGRVKEAVDDPAAATRNALGLNGTGAQANPAPGLMEVKLVSCTGDPATGEVSIVIAVTALKSEYTQANFGNTVKAFDGDGGTYEDKSGMKENVQLPVGVPVKVEMARQIAGVPAGTPSLRLVQATWYLDSSAHYGKERKFLQFSDVPIQWGETPAPAAGQ